MLRKEEQECHDKTHDTLHEEQQHIEPPLTTLDEKLECAHHSHKHQQENHRLHGSEQRSHERHIDGLAAHLGADHIGICTHRVGQLGLSGIVHQVLGSKHLLLRSDRKVGLDT